VAETRRRTGGQALGRSTYSRASGLQPSSGSSAASAQVSTIGPPNPLTFGRDPNDLTHARGLLPNDLPHFVGARGRFDIPRTGFVFAADLQRFSGKPWAATTQVLLPQGDTRLMLEPRGSRRLSSQSLLHLPGARACDR